MTTITLPTPQQPIYGVLEENDDDSEQDIYEASADYTKIDNPQPIYGELELEPENIYNQPEDEQPVYREIEGVEPGYKTIGDNEPGYKTIGDVEPDYKTVDDIYINNSVKVGDNTISPDNSTIGTLDKPKLAPKPKFIPPLSPPIRHRMASGELEKNQDFT